MLRIGTSGWSFKEWRGAFYPPDLAPARWLAYYASHLSTVELNAAFYRMPAADTIHGWYRGVPDGFTFSVKAPRLLTHRREPPSRAELERFVQAMAALDDRLGPLLFQFPPARKRDDDWLLDYLEALPSGHRYVFEFRHASWYDQAIYEALAQSRVALCLHDQGGVTMAEVQTASFGYVRFRGYEGGPNHYPIELLDAAREHILALFGRKADVYVYFHHGVAGVQDAQTFQSV